jgi:hypothetical protein
MRKGNDKKAMWLRELNRWNFKGIEQVHIVYEDCQRCPARTECPSIGRMKHDVVAVRFFKAMFKRHGVPVKTHAMNSIRNGKRHKKSLVKGAPLPLEMNILYDGAALSALATPHYCYLFVMDKDGSERIYTINMCYETRKTEAVSCPMYN